MLLNFLSVILQCHIKHFQRQLKVKETGTFGSEQSAVGQFWLVMLRPGKEMSVWLTLLKVVFDL